MDHVRYSGNEPVISEILSQKQIVSKVESDVPKVPKTSWSRKGWCNSFPYLFVISGIHISNMRRYVLDFKNDKIQ